MHQCISSWDLQQWHWIMNLVEYWIFHRLITFIILYLLLYIFYILIHSVKYKKFYILINFKQLKVHSRSYCTIVLYTGCNILYSNYKNINFDLMRLLTILVSCFIFLLMKKCNEKKINYLFLLNWPERFSALTSNACSKHLFFETENMCEKRRNGCYQLMLKFLYIIRCIC